MDNAPPPTNRLTIFHLLVWMTVTAGLFGLHVEELAKERNGAARFSGQVPPEVAAHFSRLLLADQVLRASLLPWEAIGVACALLWPWRRWQFRGGFPTQPGHWLLLALGTAFLIDRIGQTSFQLLLSALERTEVTYQWLAPSNLATIEALLSWVFPAVATSILVTSLVYRFQSRLWSVTVAILIGAMLLGFAGVWIKSTHAGLALLIDWEIAAPVVIWTCHAGYYAVLGGSVILAFIATWRDRQQGHPRDLFHYAGLVVLAAVVVDRFAGFMIGWTVW